MDDDNLAMHYDYAPFGGMVMTHGEGREMNLLCYSSECVDKELLLVSYAYRHYDSDNGRWCQRDIDEVNVRGGLYCYVGNNVCGSNDHLGLIEVKIVEERNHSCVVDDEMNVPIYEVSTGTKHGSFEHTDVLVSKSNNDAICCEVLLPVGIHIRADLETDFKSQTTAGYINHEVALNGNGDYILVARGSASYGHTKSMVIEHERGHAKAYFKWLKPWMLNDLPPYLRSKRTEKEIQDFAKYFYDLMLQNRVYLEDSARFSNQASKDWLLNNGYDYVRSDGAVDYYIKR